MTRNSRPARRTRRAAPSSRVIAFRGLAVIAVLGVVMTIALRSPGGFPGVPYRTYEAVVPDAGNLRPHNEVRIAGVRVGQVSKKGVVGRMARLELKLDPGTGPLPADTTVLIRSRGLLGQRYLELAPGRSSTMLEQDATIRGDERSLTFGVPETLDTFDRDTRGGLGTTIGELGRGLLGRGDEVNDTLRVVAPAGRRLRSTIDTALARPGAVERLVPSLHAGVMALDSARDDIAEGLTPTADTFQTLADHRGDLLETLTAAPGALRAARGGLAEGRRLVAAVEDVARAANGTLPGAPGALRATSTLLRASQAPLRRIAPLLEAAQPALPAVRRVSRAMRPVLPGTTKALESLRPTLITVGEHGCDVKNFATVWRSFLGFGVAGGSAIGPLNSIRVVATPAIEELRGGGDLIKDATTDLVDQIPYPTPCAFAPGGLYPVSPSQEPSR